MDKKLENYVKLTEEVINYISNLDLDSEIIEEIIDGIDYIFETNIDKVLGE